VVNPTNPNYYWSRAVQYQGQQGQQRQQVQGQQRQPSKQQQQQPKSQESKARDFGGFDPLIVDKNCLIKLGNGEVIKGLVGATSKYWLLVNVDGQVIIINKAWVVSVMPIQSPTNNSQENTNNNAGGTNEREQTSTQK
jgi:sRNA-binding regulator protein Hfq